MKQYITIVYEGKSYNERFGWEYGKVFLFRSKEYDDPAQAMKEFNQFPLPEKPWFACMRVVENGELIDEETFDTSTTKIS